MRTVSYSELDTYRQCPLKWWVLYTLRLRPPEDSPALTQGSCLHAVMEAHFLSLQRNDAAGEPRNLIEAGGIVDGVIADWQAGADGRAGISQEMAENVAWMYAGYVERYGTDPEWRRILGVEVKGDTPLCRSGGEHVRMKYRADLLVEDLQGRVWVVDWKTAKGRDASGAAYDRELDIDDQLGIYIAAMRRQGVPVFGAVYGRLRSDQLKRAMTPEERSGKTLMFRGDVELEVLWDDATKVTRAMLTSQRRGEEPYSSPNPSECKWKCSAKEAHLHARRTGRTMRDAVEGFGWVPDTHREDEAAREAAKSS